MSRIINIYNCAIITTIGVFYFGKIIIDERIKISNKKLIILLEIACIAYTISGIFFSKTIKSLTMILVNVIFYKIAFRISNKKAIFATFLFTILMILSELIELFVVTNILKMSIEFCYETYAGTIISNMFTYALCTFLAFLLKKLFKICFKEHLENNTKIIIFSILTAICILIFFYTIINEFRFNNDIFIYIIAIIVLISVLFSLIRQMIANNKLVKEYDQLLEFMTTYEEEIEKQRILRHETKNEFLAIRAKLADKEEEQEILKYIDDILKDKIIVKHEEYAKFGYLPPNGIKGLCYFKIQEAEKKGIIIGLNISKRIKNSTIFHLETKQQREFAKILGVFLDNAIEASIESEEKQLGIEAYITKEQEFKMIISNTFKNEIDKEKLGKESFSTKGKNRGHGLLLVNHIIKGNHIFETKTEIQGNIYSQTIIVKKQNNA